MKAWRAWITAALLACHGTCLGVDLTPWFGRDKLLEITPWQRYHYVPRLDTAAGKVKRRRDNLFCGVRLAIATNNDWAFELDNALFRTSQTETAYDRMNLTVRKKWFNDVVGDPLTVVTGVTFTAPSARSLRNFNACAHGRAECEGHIALGRECSKGMFWDSRWWTALAVGIADRGCPWLRGRASWERNFCDQHQYQLFSEGTLGTGSRSLNVNAPFAGYGEVAYRTVDLGAGYRYLMDAAGRAVSLEVVQRLYGKNAPIRTSAITLSLTIPFSL